MEALNFAIMKYMTTVEDDCVSGVIEAMKAKGYGSWKQLKPASVQETLKTAVANGLCDESRFDMDENNELRVYYKVNDYGRDMVRKFL